MTRTGAALLALSMLASTAAAQPKKPDNRTRAKAAAMFEKGSAHYEAGRFNEAIPLFKDAYELVHDPVYLFNLAQAYRKVLDCVAASEYYNRYLDEAADADKQQRERVGGWLRELQPCVDERKRDVETARAAQERAEAAERARREAEAERLRQQGPTHRTIDNGKGFRIGGYAAAGVGAIGIAIGIRYSIKGADIQDELATTCANGCDWTVQELRDKDAAGKRANTISKIAWIGGGVTFAGGVALYIIGRMKIEHITVSPVEGGAAVSAHTRF